MKYKNQQYIGRDAQSAKQRLRAASQMKKDNWKKSHWQANSTHASNVVYGIIVVLLLVFVVAGAAMSFQNVKAVMEQSHNQTSQLEKILELEL